MVDSVLNQNPYQPPQAELKRSRLEGTAKPPSAGLWIGGCIGCITFAGGLTGVAAGYAREQIRGPVHYEMVFALAALWSLSILALWCFRRIQFSKAAIYFNLSTLGVWVAFVVGWSLAQRRIWDDLVGMAAVFWFGSAAVGMILLILMTVIRQYSHRTVDHRAETGP